MPEPRIPVFAKSIQKGVPLKTALSDAAVTQLAENISLVESAFPMEPFTLDALEGIEELTLMARAGHIASCLNRHLEGDYPEKIQTLVQSFTPRREEVGDLGVSTFFYLPHSSFISQFGGDFLAESMEGMYELTMRFTSEFAIRPFLLKYPEEVLEQLMEWKDDVNPHVRRLCSEGTRPTLPWGLKLHAFLDDPEKTFLLLDALKDDSERYVTRSVANHLGDLIKKHPEWVIELCYKWLHGDPTKEKKWLIRHAVRYLAKKGDTRALELRIAAK